MLSSSPKSKPCPGESLSLASPAIAVCVTLLVAPHSHSPRNGELPQCRCTFQARQDMVVDCLPQRFAAQSIHKLLHLGITYMPRGNRAQNERATFVAFAKM